LGDVMRVQQGFTIVELVAVIVIVGILAAVSGPKFIGSDTFVARGTYSTLLSALRLAQKTAIAQRTTVYFNLNAATRVLCLGYDSSCATPVLDPTTQAAYNKTFASTVTFATSRSDIAFNSEGILSSGVTTTISVQNNVGSETARTITIEKDTGYAR
jgi:MSHA pilin protein MshC